jgi:DNA-nicking Smr family endonuclease
MSRRRRDLSQEERALWQLVAEAAKPLKPHRPIDTSEIPPKRKEEAGVAKPLVPPITASQPKKIAPAAPPKSAPGPLDRRTRTKLSRGGLEVDARLDLHGLTQRAAHQRLGRFLAEAQANGARLVLIITGRGRPTEPAEGHGEARGVLRRAVPGWLQSPEFRPLVAGLDEAGRRHGGAGALYVRIRRKHRPP